jgi:pantetheine-phosphate adenylyltransferase
MISALFPGSFDPPTYGHLNIIERARTIFSEIHVVIAVNSAKNYLFSAQERERMLKKIVEPWDNVYVHLCDSLIVEFAKKVGAKALVRGIRNMADFTYEFDLSMLNKSLDSEIETVFLPTDPKYFVLKSSGIKELASLGGDISTMVPPIVAEELAKKYRKN